MALVALTGLAQQQPETGDYIYVYQHNGEILSFRRGEIQEMAYIYEDTLGVTHDEITSQVIILDNIVHVIPLADIDSISFVTPQTVYQPGVIRIEQGLMDYVERCDSLTIYFAANTPADLLPKVGDKLTTTEMNDKFEAGFAGVVASVNGTTVVCNAVDISEIFETYYNTTVVEGQSSGEDNSNARKRIDINIPIDHTFNFPVYTKSCGQELSISMLSPLAYKVGTRLDVSFIPKCRVKATLIVNKKQGTIFNASADLTTTFQESISFYGGLEKTSQFGWEVFKQPLCPFVKFYIKPGIFTEKGVTASISNVWEQKFGTYFSFNFSEKAKQPFKHEILNHEPSYTQEMIGCVDGRLAGGLFSEMGFAPNIMFASSFVNVSLRSEFGAELVGHAVLYDDDIKNATKETSTYEKLKASNIQVNSFGTHELQKKLFGIESTNPISSVTQKIGQWDLVPKFTDISTKRTDDVVEVTLGVEQGEDYLISPVDFGVALYNSNNEMVASDYLGNYLKGSDGGTFTNFFKDLDYDEDYTVSPIVKVLGFELRASLTSDVEKGEFPVRIVSFKQTGSNYSAKQGYEYEGKRYYYKFNATTTVEIKEGTKKVKDWGYIYHDIYDVDKKISCANLGSNPYEDTRYAYYYNESERTVNLTPYIQYEGETEIKKGKATIYNLKHVDEGIVGTWYTWVTVWTDEMLRIDGYTRDQVDKRLEVYTLDSEGKYEWGYYYYPGIWESGPRVWKLEEKDSGTYKLDNDILSFSGTPGIYTEQINDSWVMVSGDELWYGLFYGDDGNLYGYKLYRLKDENDENNKYKEEQKEIREILKGK